MTIHDRRKTGPCATFAEKTTARLCWLLLAAAATIAVPGTRAETNANAIENSVVKISSSVRYPDLRRPWTKQSPVETTGSGVVIRGKRILSNAHVVLYASEVQVQANESGRKVSATVEFIAPGLDLALLKLDDDSFFDHRQAVPFAEAPPALKETVMVYGFPAGGAALAITRGIVSRLEYTGYNWGATGLRIQIDAAINPGNSGGPAIVGAKMVGLAFSRLDGADNIGYIIPNEEIALFLRDIADGQYDGKAALEDTFQTLDNPALRSFLQVGNEVEGLVVNQPGCDATDYPLKKWDVLTEIEGTPLDSLGRVKLADTDLRVDFRYLMQKFAPEDKIPITLIRAGKTLHAQLPQHRADPTLMPPLLGGYPSYFVAGPLVFSSVHRDLVDGLAASEHGGSVLGMLSMMGSPMMRRLGDKPACKGEDLVMVSSPFFPHKLAKGYDNPSSQVVRSINNVPVKNLSHLVELVRDSKDEFLTIDFAMRHVETLVFRRKELLAATDDILRDNGVRNQGSTEILAIWNAKAPELSHR